MVTCKMNLPSRGPVQWGDGPSTDKDGPWVFWTQKREKSSAWGWGGQGLASPAHCTCTWKSWAMSSMEPGMHLSCSSGTWHPAQGTGNIAKGKNEQKNEPNLSLGSSNSQDILFPLNSKALQHVPIHPHSPDLEDCPFKFIILLI